MSLLWNYFPILTLCLYTCTNSWPYQSQMFWGICVICTIWLYKSYIILDSYHSSVFACCLLVCDKMFLLYCTDCFYLYLCFDDWFDVVIFLFYQCFSLNIAALHTIICLYNSHHSLFMTSTSIDPQGRPQLLDTYNERKFHFVSVVRA